MIWARARRGPALFVLMAMLASTEIASAWAQSTDDLGNLGQQVTRLRGEGKFAQATEVAKRALALAEQQFGSNHPDVRPSLNNLALLYQAQGRYSDAEPLYRRTVSIMEKAFGPDHSNVGNSLNNLALLYQKQGRYAEAEPLYKRSLGINEKALGANHPEVGTLRNNLALLYREQGRYAEAEPLYKSSLALREKAMGPDHPNVGNSLNNLAELYWAQGRYAEAESLYKRSLGFNKKALGPDHPDVGSSLGNLAALYRDQGRYAEAEPLYKSSLTLREKALGPDHPDVGSSLNNLAVLYQSQGRYAEAEPLYKRALTLSEKALGPNHPNVGTALNNLGTLYRDQGRYAEAERLHKRALTLREKALDPDHPDVGSSLHSLAVLYQSQGRYAEAEPLYKRALTLREKALGPDHPDVGSSLGNLAGLAFVQRDWPRATDYLQRSTAVLIRRAQRGTADLGQAVTGKRKTEVEQSSWQFWGLIKVAHRLAAHDRGAEASLQREMFQIAQWAQSSEAAASVTQMAVRGAKGNAQLGTLVRERQDLVAEWQKRDETRTTAVAQASDKRDRAAEAANAARLTSIDVRLGEIDKRLVAEFPDYAALAGPAPVSVEDVQALLRPDEVVALFLDTPEAGETPEETFIWVVTKTEMRWVRSDLGTHKLTREVAALRCGLDATAWQGDGVLKCADLLSMPLDKAPAAGAPLPFDLARAHALYKKLLGDTADLIKGKHLLVVPSGPLTQLPFQVLVTETPKGGDHRSIHWLARDHALTVLPAVSSLKALRRTARPSAAALPMIGFGNPLLYGPDPSHMKRAQQARDNQRCPETVGNRAASLAGLRGGIAPVVTRAGLVDVAQIKAATPLPETTDELCAVARDLKADASEMRLGERATEREIKSLSASGRLAQYRILHFATHGAIAGQLTGTIEPGLILTPPPIATEEDDGYLSASEIADLKLDADWVILSACNTAAGGVTGAEALSGLARAFFYAQARALLVSHWEVNSDATVKLITVGGWWHGKGQGRRPGRGLASCHAGHDRQRQATRGAPVLLGSLCRRGRGRRTYARQRCGSGDCVGPCCLS